MLEDLDDGRLPEPAEPDPASGGGAAGRARPDLVTYEGWQAIDAAENAAGEPQGRPRVKFTRVEEMLDAARTSVS